MEIKTFAKFLSITWTACASILVCALFPACGADNDGVSLLQAHVAIDVSTSKGYNTTTHMSHGNICSGGKLLPKLYVLGAQKCATSTFAQDMIKLGVKPAGVSKKNGHAPKELHFFEEYYPRFDTAARMEVERGEWLQRMPDCPVAGQRRVIGDYTPSNLRTVPLPRGTRPTGSHWGKMFVEQPKIALEGTGQEINLPLMLRDFYGEASKEISLVVMLRDPLERMQSAWYHAQSRATGDAWPSTVCSECKAESFHAALDATLSRLDGLNSTGHVDDWLWASMYGRQIEAWLKFFDAKQLYVIPFKNYVLGYENKLRICNDISTALAYSADCSSLPRDVPDRNTHKHPPVMEDISTSLLWRYQKVMKVENQRLTRTLVAAAKNGAVLAGYDSAAPLTATALWRWLEAGW